MPGFQEILVIAVVALLVFGPDRLPELARNAGKALARFREETRRNVDELRRAADVQDLEQELKALRRELRDTKGEMRSGVRSMAGLGPGEPDDFGPATPPASRDSVAPPAAVPTRADDEPPPTDPEAT